MRRVKTAALIAAMVSGLLAPGPVSAQDPMHCPEGVAPSYSAGFAALHGWLGDLMGDPAECEHGVGTSGDTNLQTTRGLAYFRKSLNTVVFTDSVRHWSAGPAGRNCWAGVEIDPPTEPMQLPTFVAAPLPRSVADTLGTGPALPVSLTPVPFNVDAAGVFTALSGRCLPIIQGTRAVAGVDPEGLLGQPNGYLSRVTWRDGRVQSEHATCANTGCVAADGGALEVFRTELLAERRAERLGGTVFGNVVLHLSDVLPAEAAAEYLTAMADSLRPPATE